MVQSIETIKQNEENMTLKTQKILTEYICHKETYSMENNTYVGYGIAVQASDGSILSVMPDISVNESEVQDLIELCNSLVLDPIHLHDVVQDYLERNAE